MGSIPAIDGIVRRARDSTGYAEPATLFPARVHGVAPLAGQAGEKVFLRRRELWAERLVGG
jgi:hypothetical protein